MPTVVTKTIGALGDYTTVAAWENDTDNNLVSLDEQHDGQLIDTSYSHTAVIGIGGGTTDATRYRRLMAQPGNEYNPNGDTGARISCTVNVLYLNEAYARARNFKCIMNDPSVTRNVVWLAQRARVDALFADYGTSGSTSGRCFHLAAQNSLVTNCIADGQGTALDGFNVQTSSVELYNCLAYDSQRNYRSAVSAFSTVENCVGWGGTTVDFSMADAAVVWNNNASSDASADDDGGTGHILNIVVADEIQDYANGKFRPKLTGQLDGAGKDLSSKFTLDYEAIAHGTYSGSWNMGAYDTPFSEGKTLSGSPQAEPATSDTALAVVHELSGSPQAEPATSSTRLSVLRQLSGQPQAVAARGNTLIGGRRLRSGARERVAAMGEVGSIGSLDEVGRRVSSPSEVGVVSV